ncbi:MAG: winged helix DNA-binding protein [Clostridia bacterium]|nr:winged helix DNA-binding protein [Clostridia bacterium]
MVERFEQFSGLVSGIYRQIQKLEREEMEKYGLKGAFAQYLVVMNRRGDGMTAAQLCEICDKDKAAISRVISEMEEKGLVTRTGEKDYRATIALTEEGHKAAAYVADRATVAVTKASEGLTDTHRKLLYASLELIYSNLEKICEAGIPETI